jgi:hypothetical protein
MNYWIHRISHLAEISYPLLEKGFLSIGFSDFANSNFIEKVLENDKSYFEQQFQEKWNSVPRTRHNLWNFLKMEKGDIVLVPSWGTFYICEIVDNKPLLIGETYSEELESWDKKKINKQGDYLLRENGEMYDLGFARKVNILYSNVSREKFADAKLTARMKIRQTNSLINDLKSNIQQSIENYKTNKPIHLHSIFVDKTSHIFLDVIKKELNPDKFEKLIKTYFKSIGANDVYIPAKNENGKEGDADIIAVFENLKLIIYVQAKFQNGQISEWATNQIRDYKTNKESIDDGYNKIAWVITTADRFNDTAVNIAKENQIQMINGLEFSKMLLNAGINLLNTEL